MGWRRAVLRDWALNLGIWCSLRVDKGLSSQSYGFSSIRVWMWELDCKESWALKNWCFWSVVLEKTLESPLDCKEIQPVHPNGNQVLNIHWKDWCWSWKSNTLPPDVKNWLIGKDCDAGRDWGQEEKGTTENDMVGWHHQLNGHGFGWTLGVNDGQGGLVCCGSWCRKESNTTERLNWAELIGCLLFPLTSLLSYWCLLGSTPNKLPRLHLLTLPNRIICMCLYVNL